MRRHARPCKRRLLPFAFTTTALTNWLEHVAGSSLVLSQSRKDSAENRR